MKTISLKIDDALDGWLAREAGKLGRTKSAIARDALNRQRRNGAQDSIHDRMQGVCGQIQGGPKDYASNPKYLKGLGR